MTSKLRCMYGLGLFVHIVHWVVVVVTHIRGFSRAAQFSSLHNIRFLFHKKSFWAVLDFFFFEIKEGFKGMHL